MLTVNNILETIEAVAPLVYQEDYDNAGLITGNREQLVTGVMLSLDTTEEVVEEAIANNCNLIIAHHPIVFKGLKKINGSNYVEKTIIKAIKNDIAIYAAHTNLDNVLQNGVNQKLAEVIGLHNISILAPKSELLQKLSIFIPHENLEQLKNALFEIGAGNIANYSECSFSTQGIGTFKPTLNAQPIKGTQGISESVNEVKLEVILPGYLSQKAIQVAKKIHPYEEMAYDLVPLANANQAIGAGAIGELEHEMESQDFLKLLKEKLNLSVVKHTEFNNRIKKVAVCGGVGSFLIHKAKDAKADAYVTSDLKYHEYFDAENHILLCDVGHYESEIYTLDIFYELIKEKFPTFAVVFCKKKTNPIQYFK
ncbi:MAG: Nif3-like dinuclear metal center hexameric protein [Bacteroidetes bacterium]|nr:Nif3-like dinuclear metal center hexameric protein [Bacteroidota bacterium]